MLNYEQSILKIPNHHLNRLCVVVNVDHPHPLILEVLRLLWEDHVRPAIAELLLVYVEDPSLNLVLEKKVVLNFLANFVCLEIFCNSKERYSITCHAKLWKLEKSALLELKTEETAKEKNMQLSDHETSKNKMSSENRKIWSNRKSSKMQTIVCEKRKTQNETTAENLWSGLHSFSCRHSCTATEGMIKNLTEDKCQ